MVWNTTQSAFYRAIDAFNNGETAGGERHGHDEEPCCERAGERSEERYSERDHRNRDEDCCRREDRDCRGIPEERCPGCRACQYRPAAPPADLFSDRDMLLIAGLLLILSHQNADKKLILALAFVLLT